MPFCTNCGGSITGAFCTNCGTPVKPAATTAAPPAPAAAAAPPAAAGKSNVLLWVVGIFAGLIVLGIVAMVAGGWFLAHKAKQAGLDPGLLQRNPAIAITKMIAAVNKDVEVVSVDEGKGLVTVLDKKTGERMTLNFEDIQQGRIQFKTGKNETLTVQAPTSPDARSWAMEAKTPEGATAKFGAGADVKIPDWIPSYRSSTPQGTSSLQGSHGQSGSYQFTTKDALNDVLSFYDQRLKQAGFKITSQSATAVGVAGGVLSAEDAGQKRTVVVTATPGDGGTTVNVLFQVKN